MAKPPSLATRNTLGPAERLRSRKILDAVFAGGRTLTVPGYRLHWIEIRQAASPASVAFSVPKRNLKRAVDRNRVKRLMREAYRRNKHPVYNSLAAQDIQVALVLIFTGRGVPAARDAEDKIILLLQRFTENACGKRS